MNMALKIGLDMSATVVPKPTGVALAILKCARALEQDPGIDLRLYYRASRYKKRRWIQDIGGSQRSWFTGPFFRRHGLQLFHGPDTRLPSFLPKGVKRVTTIHDFSALQGEEFSKPSFRETRTRHYEEAVARSDLICCYTQAIANELHERFQFPEEKTRVVPLAPALASASPEARVEVQERLGSRPYILVLGELSARKNTAFAIRSYLQAREESAAVREVQLILAGRPGYRADEVETLLATQPPGVLALGYVDKSWVGALLEQSMFLYFPTRYEGFGLPVVEAMSLGVPVLAGACGAVSEVAGAAALLIDPERLEEAVAGLVSMVENGELRQQYKCRGQERANALSWENTGKLLRAAYLSVL
jgi:glycosyltransferase involved in cell wall biosynthesis